MSVVKTFVSRLLLKIEVVMEMVIVMVLLEKTKKMYCIDASICSPQKVYWSKVRAMLGGIIY